MKWQDENCDILDAMKAMWTSVFLLLITGAVRSQVPQVDVASREGPFYAGVSDTASLEAVVMQRTADADEHLKALLDVRDARTIDNTLLPYDRMGMEIDRAFTLTRISVPML